MNVNHTNVDPIVSTNTHAAVNHNIYTNTPADESFDSNAKITYRSSRNVRCWNIFADEPNRENFFDANVYFAKFLARGNFSNYGSSNFDTFNCSINLKHSWFRLQYINILDNYLQYYQVV